MTGITAAAAAPRLDRALLGVEAAPVRIVHLGLGAFARSHQAWWTDRVDDDREWGIAAFAGRTAPPAGLVEQGGVFTLIERGTDRDRADPVASLSRVGDADPAALAEAVRDPAVALVTITCTEAAYAVDPDAPPASSALGRLALALDARRAGDRAPIALVPCDNLPANGAALRAALDAIAARHLPELAAWLAADDGPSIVSTSVDRITPAATPADADDVLRLRGWRDAAPVVAEPFCDWVLSGGFPAGRPAWERAGARLVPDIVPFERRKLWLLNGAHTLLAAAGPPRGHGTVAEAIGDPALRAAVERLWDTAARHLDAADLDLDRYRADLLARFDNPRIRHALAQIAVDAAVKLRTRVVPVAIAELAAGRDAAACAVPIAAWIATLGGDGRARDALDPDLDAALAAATSPCDLAARLVAVLSPELADHESFLRCILEAAP